MGVPSPWEVALEAQLILDYTQRMPFQPWAAARRVEPTPASVDPTHQPTQTRASRRAHSAASRSLPGCADRPSKPSSPSCASGLHTIWGVWIHAPDFDSEKFYKIAA